MLSGRPPLAVVLVVRDEAQSLPAALRSLEPLRAAGLLRTLRVHDTGSADATVAIARAAGAEVTLGGWDGDFAAARNQALRGIEAAWVLSLDADERVVADVPALTTLLCTSRETAFSLRVDNTQDAGDYSSRAERLFRPAQVRWEGRVHERLAHRTQDPLPLTDLDPLTLRLTHTGYDSETVRRTKCARNAVLAQADLDALAAGPAPDPARVAQVLLDLGRSFAGAGRAQDAVDALEALRTLAPGTQAALEGTDALTRVLLGAGLDEVALVLVAELRNGGAPKTYCDWLEAQARAQLGEVGRAYALVKDLREVVDTAGRRHPQRLLDELRELLAQLQTVGANRPIG